MTFPRLLLTPFTVAATLLATSAWAAAADGLIALKSPHSAAMPSGGGLAQCAGRVG